MILGGHFNPQTAGGAIYDLWLLWAASWLLAAPFAARAIKRSPSLWLPLVLSAALIFVLAHGLGLAQMTPLWRLPAAPGWALAGLALVGFAFAGWARLTLGRLWSGSITLKQDHRLIDRGPYALVRHPIYTGILLAVLASAAEQGTVMAAVMSAAVVAGLVAKAVAEERFLAAELGAAPYAAYRARVPMLVPFL